MFILIIATDHVAYKKPKSLTIMVLLYHRKEFSLNSTVRIPMCVCYHLRNAIGLELSEILVIIGE